MERAEKVYDALCQAGTGAFLVLFYLHRSLEPQVPEVERLWSWAVPGWLLSMLLGLFFMPKDADGKRARLSPAVIGGIAVIAIPVGIVVAVTYGLGLSLPWYLNTPLMALPLCLVVAWFAARSVSRNADRFGEARVAASGGDGAGD